MKLYLTSIVLLMVTVAETAGAVELRSPTSNVLSRLVWLGDENNTPQGSGTLISADGVDYVITAHHVYLDCGGNPSVRFRGQWNSLGWEVLARDEGLDVIVMRSPQLPKDLAGLPVLYGVPRGAIHGQIGYSLGFPGVFGLDSGLRTDHILEVDGRPIPIAALVVANLSTESKVHYSASYINAGFSGGAIVYYVEEQEMWTIAGMITQFPAVPRAVYDRNGKETGQFIMQHTGLVGYVPMSAVLELIEVALLD